ncbi:hypothetical protein B0H10DRAFT_1308257 [Mycena sp. CBHHK59/15]|nr:hypothetical protein B0H10DRAFT_1308257 [Mycena sp. CBHHK59/15]
MALSKRPLSPLQRPPSVSSQAQVSATPPSSAPQAEEEVPGASAALISDIIDLTLSDHEGADSARATAEATSAPIRPLPRSATQSIEEAREMQLKRLTALISRSGKYIPQLLDCFS